MTEPTALKPEVPVSLKPYQWQLIVSELRHLATSMTLPIYRELAAEIEKQISVKR